MYHVTGTGIIVFLLYSISYILYRSGFYSQLFHRKLWNSVLTLAFIFVSLAGIFLTLQSNYKWNVPFIKTILKWHVEAGALLVFSGFLHLFWHLSYFLFLFKKNRDIHAYQPPVHLTSETLKINLFIVGFTGISVQFLLMREVMNISGGYELIAGVFLGSWLIASAAGAALAVKSKLNDPGKINLFFSLSPFVTIVLMIILTRLFLARGETPSLLVSIVFTFLLLLPFCLVSGFTFVKLLFAAKITGSVSPGNSYSIETAGGIAAGIIVSVLTAGILDTYQILITTLLLTLAYTLLTYFIKRPGYRLLVRITFVTVISLGLISHPDLLFRQLLLPGIRVKDTKDTPYGNITRGILSDEESIYYNEKLLAYNDDVMEREEDIHYALLQRPHPEKVIMVSGALAPRLEEILKYPVKKVVYIERDPALAEAGLPPDYKDIPGLRIEKNDAFRFLRTMNDRADAVLLLLPPPSTLSLNRYYTVDFFRAAGKDLVPGGVFMCSPGPGINYLNKESVDLYSSIFNSLSEVFRYVVPIVGNKMYFIASDEKVSTAICKLTGERKISNYYVCPDYLADDLIEQRSQDVISALDPGVRVNTSAFPVACFHSLSFSFSMDPNEKIPSIILLILAFVVPVLAVGRRNVLMYAGASSLAGFEIIVLLTIQLTAGNMYQFTGMVLAVMMAGLATGAGSNLRVPGPSSIKIKALILAIYYIIIVFCFDFVFELQSLVPALIIILLSIFLPSYLTGNIFREITASANEITSAGSTYSADLAGSALGFILISGIALPVLGMKASMIFLSLIIIAGILFGTNGNK